MELKISNAADYLVAKGLAPPEAHISELGGGVSNTVLLVEFASERFVVKQALGKLRVEQEWLSDRERIFRESAALRKLAPLLARGSLPAVRFEDRENFIYLMDAAPAGSVCWKDLLLGGEIRPETAETVGALLAAMVGVSWRNPVWASEFGDQTVFDQLRIDPYYRTTARRHPDLAPRAERLMRESAARRVSLTHGDWSPKNFLVDGVHVMAIDFEVIHFGDPSFDLAFMLNHLLLKSFYRPQWADLYKEAANRFWQVFVAEAPAADWWDQATVQHLGWLLLARVDGKSPVEYLRDAALRDSVRQFARNLIVSPPESVAKVFQK